MADQRLAQCLLATLDPNAEARRAAEAALEAGASQPGFSTALISVALAPDVADGVRQLAAVVLKKHIKEHWTPESAKFKGSIISEEEKAAVRAALPSGLSDTNTKINTAVAMAVAEIAKWDCPQQWPGLIPGLVRAITDKSNPNLVSGAVRCYGMFVDELSEEQVAEIAPALLPELLHIVANPSQAPELRQRALGIFRSTLEVLDLLARTRPSDVKALLAPILPGWMAAFTAILEAPTTAEGAALWGVKQCSLACLVKLVPSFGKLAGPHLPPIMSAAWGMLTSCLPLYEALVVEEDDGAVAATAAAAAELGSGQAVGLEELLTEVFEFVLTLLGSGRFLGAIRPSLPTLAYLSLGYMRVSAVQAERWGTDANAYIAEGENEFWNLRASGEMLLDEILEIAEEEGLAAMAAAVERRSNESTAARAAGAEGWWRDREAVLLGIGAVAERLVEAGQMGAQLPPPLQPAVIVAGLLAEDLSGRAPPLLAGRALWLASRLVEALPPAALPPLLQVAAAALAASNPPPVCIGGCQALGQLCRRVTKEQVAAVADAAFGGLCTLLGAATEDSLHLVLEALTALVRMDAAGAARWEQHVTPGALTAWVENITDPLVAEDAADLLRALAKVPGCLPALQARMLPTLLDVIARPQPHSPFLLAGCLDMLVGLLAPSPPQLARPIVAAATPPALALLLGSDEDEVTAAATAYLRTVLQVGGADALGWWGAGDPGAGLGAMLGALQHVLRPDASDYACRHAGGLLMELLRNAAPQVAPHLPALLGALSLKLCSAEDPGTVQPLLSVLAHLARVDAGQLVACLQAAGSLQPTFQKWADRQMEIRTPYDIRLTTTALGCLLACPHPALDEVTVRGKRTDTGGGIRTRARGKTLVEQWSVVPLRVKIIALLADAYIEATTQEEEVDGLDDDDYEEEEEEGGGEWTGAGAGGAGHSLGDRELNFLAKHSTGFVDFSGSQDGDDAEDLLLGYVDPLEAARRKADPLGALDLAAHVAEVFKGMAAANPALMQAGAAELTDTQTAVVQRIWQQ